MQSPDTGEIHRVDVRQAAFGAAMERQRKATPLPWGLIAVTALILAAATGGWVFAAIRATQPGPATRLDLLLVAASAALTALVGILVVTVWADQRNNQRAAHADLIRRDQYEEVKRRMDAKTAEAVASIVQAVGIQRLVEETVNGNVPSVPRQHGATRIR